MVNAALKRKQKRGNAKFTHARIGAMYVEKSWSMER